MSASTTVESTRAARARKRLSRMAFPDESTVRKLPRRLGPSVVEEITRVVIEKTPSSGW